MLSAARGLEVRRGARAGFTLVEIIVVIVIIGVLATLIVPRVLGGAARAGDAEARAVTDMLSAVGARQALSPQSLAIEFDEAQHTLRVLAFDAGDTASGTGTGAGNRAGGYGPVRSIRPVSLSATRVGRFTIDGRPALGVGTSGGQGSGATDGANRAALIELSDDQFRPALSIVLVLAENAASGAANDRAGPAWQIDLLPTSTTAVSRTLGSASAFSPALGGLSSPSPEAVDLDAMGQRNNKW